MLPKRRIGLSFVLCAALSCVFGCTGDRGGTARDVTAIRMKIRQPLTLKEQEALLEPGKLSSIGEMAAIDGLEPLPCLGIGLVTGLNGKGSQASNLSKDIVDEAIKVLVREEGRSVQESRALVDSRDSSIVLVRGSVPSGAGPGDRFDVFVQAQDAALSLHGGLLHSSDLHRYLTSERQTVTGETVAKASGQVMPAERQEGMVAGAASGRIGVVYDGGVYQGERVFIIGLKPQYATAAKAVLIEVLLNRRFRIAGAVPGTVPIDYATALSGRVVLLRVPPVYRRYVQRFADVVRSIRGAHFHGTPSESELRSLQKRLQSGDREEKYAASTALEAIGSPAIPYIADAVEAGDDWTLVYGATALAYLNQPEATDLLVRAANSPMEEVRYEAVRLLAQVTGRQAMEALREKVEDTSGKVVINAVIGLIGQGPEAARMIRMGDFDLVGIPQTQPGLRIKTGGRPMFVVTGLGTQLLGKVEVNFGDIGIGSIDDKEVGIVTGADILTQSVSVDATVDSVLTTLARQNVPFNTVRKILEILEARGNLPYQIVWLD